MRTAVRDSALYMFFFYAVYFAVVIIIQSITEINHPGYDDFGPLSIISIAVGSLVFLIPRKKRLFTDIAMPAAEPMTPKIFIILVVATQAIQFVYSIIIWMVDTLLPEGLSLEESYAEMMEGMITPVGLVYIILIGPIFEELIFRGAVMGPLRKFGDNFAILFSSLIFGFYHMQMAQIPFAFVLGLLLGYVAARWSLRASIALHITVNGLACLISDSGDENVMNTGGFFMLLCVILSAVFLIVWRNALKLRIQDSAAFYPHTYANGFSSRALWAFLAVMALGGIAQMYVTI